MLTRAGIGTAGTHSVHHSLLSVTNPLGAVPTGAELSVRWCQGCSRTQLNKPKHELPGFASLRLSRPCHTRALYLISIPVPAYPWCSRKRTSGKINRLSFPSPTQSPKPLIRRIAHTVRSTPNKPSTGGEIARRWARQLRV